MKSSNYINKYFTTNIEPTFNQLWEQSTSAEQQLNCMHLIRGLSYFPYDEISQKFNEYFPNDNSFALAYLRSTAQLIQEPHLTPAKALENGGSPQEFTAHIKDKVHQWMINDVSKNTAYVAVLFKFGSIPPLALEEHFARKNELDALSKPTRQLTRRGNEVSVIRRF